MDKNFKVTEAPAREPVIFDIIFAEKVGGGIVKNAAYTRLPGLAVSEDGECLKAARLVEAITSESTSLKVEKDNGFAVNDYIATGKVAKQISAIDRSHADYDILTVTMGVALAKGAVLYEAAEASVAAVAEVAYGYYDADSETAGALKVVASSAGEGEIALADVTPYHGIKNLAANDYVLPKNKVDGVAGVDATPKVAPFYVLGTKLPANCGDELAKLVNGGNIRKENALFPAEIAAQMKGIHLQ